MYITHEDKARYDRDGYLLVERLFDDAEVAKMIAEAEGGGRVANSRYSSADGSGKKVNLAIWQELGSDIWSAASTCPRIVNTARVLMGEEISFYHGKVMMKEARTGGASEWHQDYGYWYQDGFLYPHMLSAFVALDPATRENGCLRVLQGSHRLGRLEHQMVGEQVGADPERVRLAERSLETVYCEMSPGSVLFFHCNTLHTSAPNESDRHRRAFIMCYSAWGNPQWLDDVRIRRDACPVGPNDAIAAL